MRKELVLASLFLLGPLGAEEIAPPPAQEFQVNLKNPVFSQGVISTDEGGVITAPGMRIQARKITYTNRIENGIPVQKVEAEEDLMIEYGERAFVGNKLEYNFLTKTGTLWEGKTFVDIWFLGGEKIHLAEDGSYTLFNAYVTTCESQEGGWDIHARTVQITKQHLLSAKSIRFRFGKMPIFWLPNFKANLGFVQDSPIRYKIKWDKGLGPRLTMRYRFFSWEKFHAYFRFDYRIKKGPGAAIETDYRPPDKKTVFRTRSYGAWDKSWPDEKTNKRYRLQGLYHTQTRDDKTIVHMTYDKLSDAKMPGDFKSEDFEVDTQKRTRLLVSHHNERFLGSFNLQPRINDFQTINQELPFVTGNVRPFQFGNSGIISDNFFNAGYLDYVFATSLDQFLHSTRAGRLETRNQVYRPFNLSHFTVTPTLGFVGIYYSNSFVKHELGQALLTYGGTASTHLFRIYGHLQHMVEPYVTYEGITSPTAGVDKHYIFNIDDGYARLNLLRVGVKNTLFSKSASSFLPPVMVDLFTYGFFSNKTYNRTFPKFYLNAGWNRPTYSLIGGFAWNQEEKLWDFTNVRGSFTLSENLAFGSEFRHRSSFDWRKGNHENFIMDATRPIDDLLKSPMSDRRNTLLFRLYGRLMPGLTCLIQTHHGWGRKHEPFYNEFKIEFFQMITCSWQLKLGYQYTINDPFQITASVQIVKPKP
jgi:hypothetical protein